MFRKPSLIDINLQILYSLGTTASSRNTPPIFFFEFWRTADSKRFFARSKLSLTSSQFSPAPIHHLRSLVYFVLKKANVGIKIIYLKKYFQTKKSPSSLGS